MQDPSHSDLELTFPKKYMHRIQEYRKRQHETPARPKRPEKSPSGINVFTNNCKQSISIGSRMYCCVLKELLDRSLCKACPCHEPEPIEYSLFKRE